MESCPVGQSRRGSSYGRGKRHSKRMELGGSDVYGCNTTKENGKVVIGSRHEEHRLYGKQLMYYIVLRAFISIPSIIVLYSFPHTLCSKKKKLPTIRLTILTPQSSPRLCNCLFLPQTADCHVERHDHPIVHYIMVVECACKERSIHNWKKNTSEIASQRFEVLEFRRKL
jgi:hypothetical protein